MQKEPGRIHRRTMGGGGRPTRPGDGSLWIANAAELVLAQLQGTIQAATTIQPMHLSAGRWSNES